MEPRTVLWVNAGFSIEHLWPAPWRVLERPPQSIIHELKTNQFDAIILEFPMPHWTPSDLLQEIQQLAPGTPTLVRAPEASQADAVRLAKQGLYQMLAPGEDPFELVQSAVKEQSRPIRSTEKQGLADWELLLVGASHEMRRVSHIIRLIGGRRSTVLITGETGTGKELAARALHLAGPRRRNPFVAVNCSALPDTLLEAELFGHVRGAFTGAVQARAGRFELAHGGTLFLDEIGELPLELQAKLLRVLQEREFQRLGSSETIRVDVRVVAATNCDLAQKIAQAKFREDLFYRLNVIPLHLPPLRQRREDIPLLAAHFLEKVCRVEGIALKSLSTSALQHLCQHDWPGNVRQLENAIETAVVLSDDRQVLSPVDFPLSSFSRSAAEVSGIPAIALPETGLDYERTLAGIERSILEQALERTAGNKKAAAAMLRLKRTTLSAKVRSLESMCG